MKRVLALVGLIMIGALLLADPNTGVVADTEAAVSTSILQATPTTAPPDPGADDPDASTSTSGVTSTTTPPDTQATSTAPETSNATAAADGMYTGQAVDSEFGDFQVEITVVDGVMTSITTLAEPGDRKSERINASAIPYYTEQALDLQSADLDAMSGATVTWESWGASLESALEQAGLA